MKREFNIEESYKHYIYLFTGIIFLIITIFQYFDSERFSTFVIISIPFSIILIFFSCLQLSKRFIFDENERCLIKKSFIRKQHIHFLDVKGFRSNKIISYIKGNDIFIGDLDKNDEIITLLQNHFQNLTQLDEINHKNELFSNIQFGRNEEDRINKFNQSQKINQILTFTSIGIGLLLIYCKSYELPMPENIFNILLLFSLLVSFCLVSLFFLYKGLFTFFVYDGNPRSSILISILNLCIGLFVHTFSFEIISYTTIFWIILVGISIFLSLLILITTKEIVKLNLTTIVLLLFMNVIMFFFTFNSVVFINCLMDTSEPVIYKTEVIHLENKVHDKSTEYFVSLQDIHHSNRVNKLKIKREQYISLKIGDFVNVNLKQGVFKLKWFYVEYPE